MSLNAAAIETLIAKGLSAADILDVARAMERKSDPTNAERQARYRAKRKEGTNNAVTVTPVTPPNERDNLTPREMKNTDPKGSCKKSSFPAPDDVPEDVWSDFLESPKRRKAGMSATAYTGITNNLRTLAEHGYPPGKMIALAVERGWTTVKLEWVQNDERQSSSNITSLRGHRPDPALDLLRAASAAEDRENRWGAGSSVPAIGSG